MINIFKKHKEEKPLTWDDITYRQAMAIKDANEIEDETDKIIAIVQAVFGDEVINLSIADFKKKMKQLEFLSKPIEATKHVKSVTVNGRTYKFDGLVGKLTAAQYIDFQNFIKDKDDVKKYAVFFIPEGHTYNDGYDMLQVFEDIKDMPITTLESASFFFLRQLELFIRIFQHYLIQTLKKNKISKKNRETLEKMIMNLSNLAYYPISSGFAK